MKVYDINLRKGISSIKNIVKNSLKISTILKMNQEESYFVKNITGCSTIDKIFDKTSLDYIFVTLGQTGAKMYTVKGEKYLVQAPETNVIDTTGCGDAFTAAVIYGLHKKWANQKILRYSVKFSSEVSKYEGAFNKTQLDKLIKNQSFS
jgi:sugar/nucleoside kinase (ribokinase family)